MNPIDPPRWFGSPIGTAKFKSHAEDFQVEEVLGFEPSGEGEHCLLWIQKTGRNTNDVAADLAIKLGIRKRLISHCGLKDKDAITRQWFSLHLPGQASPSANDWNIHGVRILRVTRNSRKLHRGTHDANRFFIRLRDVTGSRGAIEQRWSEIVARGVPNYFGPQRFGHGGRNVEQAIEMFQGRSQVRDRLVRGILISAVRSYLFNACVARRVSDETLDTVLPGDVFGFANNRSLILPDNLRGNEPERLAAGELELTAPLWGDGDLQSQETVLAMEKETVECYSELIAGLAEVGTRQERRVIRLRPTSPNLVWEDDTTLVLTFDLPKGTYATAVLRELVEYQSFHPRM